MFTVSICCCSILERKQTTLRMSSSSSGRASASTSGPSQSGDDVLTSTSTINQESHSSSTSVVQELRVVWDFEKIERLGGPDAASKKWRCNWCGLTLSGWNATKALSHVTKSPGNNDVKRCTGNIPKATLALFQQFRFGKKGVASVKRKHAEVYAEKVACHQMSLSVCYQDTRTRTSSATAGSHRLDTFVDGSEDVSLTNATKLTTAIAEFVYCKGLPFSITEGDQFLQILKLSRLVPHSYRPPSRKLLSNDLLDISYDSRLKKYQVDLEMDADVYGLSLFGDGATVHGMPLMNILAAGVGEPSAVLEIVNCK